MSLKSHSNARNFFFDGFKNELRHLCPLNRSQIFEQNSLQYLVNETTECFKTDCRQNFMDRNDRNLIFSAKFDKNIRRPGRRKGERARE